LREVVPTASAAAEYVGQSHYLTLRQGETARAYLQVRNTGTQTWYRDGAAPVYLGTSAPRNRASPFAGGYGWRNPYRIALPLASVPPGGGVTIEFDWTVPRDLSPGVYRESFELLAEQVTWIPGMAAYWDLTVVPGIGAPAGTLPVVLLGLLGIAAVGAAAAFGRRSKEGT